VEPPVRIEL